MILSALMAALTAAGALLRVPTPVSSFTLQIFFTALAGLILGPRWGAVSQMLYVLLGLLGLPVFTGGGGPAALLHPTGGFLPGMILMAWVIGSLSRSRSGFWRLLTACLAGLGALYTIGLPWMYAVMNVYGTLSVGQTVLGGMLLFLPWDLLKILAATVLCLRLRPHLLRFIVPATSGSVNKGDF